MNYTSAKMQTAYNVPIITGQECLIPFRLARVQPVDNDNDSTDDEDLEIEEVNDEKKMAKPRRDVQEMKVDFWKLIQGLNWSCREEIGIRANRNRANQCWSNAEFTAMQVEIAPYVHNMRTALEMQHFWERQHIDSENDRDELIYHIIAKGKITYEAILQDSDFAIAYIGQASGFRAFMDLY